MVVYRPKRNITNNTNNTNNVSSTNLVDTNDEIIDNDDVINETLNNDSNSNSCECDCHHHHHHCPCPKPVDACITISVDDAPAVIETDIIYGPPGKDGTINGYNEVEIKGGNNIEVVTDRNVITINSITSEFGIDTGENNCNCQCCNEFEQVKPCSCWNIKHYLNKYPSVTVVNEDNHKEIICEVQYISKNELNLRFNGRFRGKAYLN